MQFLHVDLDIKDSVLFICKNKMGLLRKPHFVLEYSWLICCGARANSFYGRREIAFAKLSSSFRDKIPGKGGILWI